MSRTTRLLVALLIAVYVALPSRAAATTPPMSRLNIAIVGDVSTSSDLTAILNRVNVVNGSGVDFSQRPNAIEVVTNIDLGSSLNNFSVFDSMRDLAKNQGLYLFLRVKPHVSGSFQTAKYFDIIGTAGYKDSTLASFFDTNYQAAVKAYYGAVAAHFANDPTVIGYGIAIGPNGEAQYQMDHTYITDFSDAAFNDYQAWMASQGVTVTTWPATPVQVAQNTQLAYSDPNFYLWAYWRVLRLNQILSDFATQVKNNDPEAYVGAFSYFEPIAACAGYGPGFLEDSSKFDYYLGSISLDHGWFNPRNQDRSRPTTMGYTTKTVGGEFDLISAYTDPMHMEAFVRLFYLMNMQPRPFMPVWWNPSYVPTSSAEGFYTLYSDSLARQMTGLVNANRYLSGTQSVADVAVIEPNITGAGVESTGGALLSDEFMISHTNIVRHLSMIGSNFDLLTEDTLTTDKLNHYKLVIVISPALYPWVRTALSNTIANVLVLGWAGTITAAGPGDLTHAYSWLNSTPTWWPTGGTVVQRKPRITFTNDPLLGSVANKVTQYGSRTQNVCYVKGLAGYVLARDDQNQVVCSRMDWNNGRRIYHFGLPLYASGQGQILSDSEFRIILTNILQQAGCTAYGDLGPLRLYETSGYLLVENPAGTSGTLDSPSGDYVGTIVNQLKNSPAPSYLDASGRIILNVPAGKSIVIPLHPSGPYAPWTWQYNNFTGASGLVFSDNATAGQPRAGIVNDGTQDVARIGTAGSSVSRNSMWYASKVQVRDGFATQFTFRFSNGSGWANGIEFIVSNNPGYEPLGVLGRDNQMLGIKFDDHNDHNEGDITGVTNNLGIKLGISNMSVGGMINLGSYAIDLRDSQAHAVLITYSGAARGKLWNVYVDNVRVVTNRVVDLARTEDATTHQLTWQDYDSSGLAWIGITGGTGGSSQNQDVLGWAYGPPDCAPQPTGLSGTVALKGFSGDLTTAAAAITLLQGATTVATSKSFLAADGSFAIYPLDAGTYDVSVSVPGWLTKTTPGVAINGPTAMPAVTLLGGDLDGDNAVGASDYNILSGSFGQSGN